MSTRPYRTWSQKRYGRTVTTRCTYATTGLQAADDDVIFSLAKKEGRVLVSADTDFGTLLALSGDAEPSVLLLRSVASHKPDRQAALLLANLPAVEDSLARGSIVVIERGRIRVRALPIVGAP